MALNRPQLLRIDAAGLADAQASIDHDASILLDRGRILAAGPSSAIDQHEAAPRATRINRPESVLIPGLVNAHCHLDLTHIGPTLRPDSFDAFIELVRARRQSDESAVSASVRHGIDFSRRGGAVAVGDIAGAPQGNPTLVPYKALTDSSLAGVSFLEFFGIGRGEQTWRSMVSALLDSGAARAATSIRIGLQPHAPTSVSLASYRWAIELADAHQAPVATHLAETIDEREFIAHARGPTRAFLERLGLWDDTLLADLGRGRHPVEYLAQILTARPLLLAHVNDAPDAAIDILARTRASVAYCPRASDYFAPALAPHRYRDMLAAGVNVCLGTDSIINLPAADVAARGLSVLDDARLLYRRDGTPADLLLRMATTHGAAALGLDVDQFSLREGAMPFGIVAVDVTGTDPARPAADRAMAGTRALELINSKPE